MKQLLIAASLAAAFGTAQAQQPVKIGMPLTLSGQFADAASQMLNGARTYMKMHGDTVAGRKIELITKDVGGPAPDVAKRLSQELVVRDNVDILAGYVLTPNAMAGGDVSAEAKKFMVVMNAATSVVITKSPYMIRTSVTLPQVMETFGTWAAKQGIKQSYTMVTDYGPGHDAEAAFQSAFKAAGGTIVGSVRFPVANPDFSAFVQRAKDIAPESIYIFIPGGAQPAALGKAFAERGIDKKKTRILGSGETTAEAALKSMGDTALDIITAWHYDYTDKNPLNQKFVKEYNARGERPQPGLLLDRRLRRHARDLRDAEEDQRQDRRRGDDRRRQGPEVGQPARPDDDRPRDARRGAERVHPPRAEGRQRAGERAVRHHPDGEGPGRRAEETGRGEEVDARARGDCFPRSQACSSTGSPTGCCCSCCRWGCR